MKFKKKKFLFYIDILLFHEDLQELNPFCGLDKKFSLDLNVVKLTLSMTDSSASPLKKNSFNEIEEQTRSNFI